jgi:hypothetical protein
VNIAWISAIAKTLSIDTKKIKFDFPTDKTGTDRIVEICKVFKGTEYLASEKAPGKYLDVELLKKNEIKFVPFKSSYQTHVFEMFDKFGIEKTINILKDNAKRKKTNEAPAPGSKEGSGKPVEAGASK